MARSFDRRAIAHLAAAHLVNDVNQAAVLGLLPFLVAQRGLGYATASSLVTVLQLSAAVVQPVLGHRADARPSRLVMPVALVAGAIAVAAIGLVDDGAMTAAVLVAGVATAAFHPESTRLVRSAGGDRTSTALGLYTLGGNLGTAIGPVIAIALVGAFGWRGPCLLAGPAAIAAWLVGGRSSAARRGVWTLPAVAIGQGAASRVGSSAARRRVGTRPAVALAGQPAAPRWRAFFRYVVILILRAGCSTCITAFAPLYLVRVRGWQPGVAGLTLTIVLLASVIAGAVAGPLADRVGVRRVLLVALVPLGPLLVGFTVLPVAAAIPCLVLVGAGTMAVYVVALGAAQDCLPGRAGLAAGVAMGVGTALGSVAVLAVGYIADAAGLAIALRAAVVLPVAAAVVAAIEPRGTVCGLSAGRTGCGGRAESAASPG